MGKKINNILNFSEKYNIVIKYFIALTVIIFLVNHVRLKENILPALYSFQYSKLLPSIILIKLHIGCLFLLWVDIVRNLHLQKPSLKLLFHSFFGGRTLAFLTPGQVGDLLKGMFFLSGERLEGTSASILFSICNSLVRIILGIIAYFYIYLNYNKLNFDNIFFILGIGLFIFFILIILIYKLFFKNNLFKSKIELIKIMKKQISNTSYNSFFRFFLFAIIANLLSALAFLTVLSGLNYKQISLDGFMAFEAALLSLALVPVTPSGMGVREGFRVYFFTIIGYKSVNVLSASFIVFGLNIVFPALIGIISLKYFLNNTSYHK